MTGAIKRLGRWIPEWPMAARAEDAELALRFFYAAQLWLATTLIYEVRNSYRTILVDTDKVHWPAFWVPWVRAERAFLIAAILMTAGAFVAAMRPHRRWARIAACVGLWEFVAVMVSIGELFPICHQWVVVSLIFAFIPDRFASPRASKDDRDNAMLLFWAGQAMFLLTYSMAGFSKFATAAWQTAHGQASIFTVSGCANMAAGYILEKGRLGPVGMGLKQAGLLPVVMFAAACAELGALTLAFRGRWHRFAGALVVSFHVGTYLIMGIFFKSSVLLAAVLLLGSPFAPRDD